MTIEQKIIDIMIELEFDLSTIDSIKYNQYFPRAKALNKNRSNSDCWYNLKKNGHPLFTVIQANHPDIAFQFSRFSNAVLAVAYADGYFDENSKFCDRSCWRAIISIYLCGRLIRPSLKTYSNLCNIGKSFLSKRAVARGVKTCVVTYIAIKAVNPKAHKIDPSHPKSK